HTNIGGRLNFINNKSNTNTNNSNSMKEEEELKLNTEQYKHIKKSNAVINESILEEEDNEKSALVQENKTNIRVLIQIVNQLILKPKLSLKSIVLISMLYLLIL
ncbi:MAG: hypothetical protein MJ252_28625, partial [archaeon]|nr:hypothetical protein [archaeon]